PQVRSGPTNGFKAVDGSLDSTSLTRGKTPLTHVEPYSLLIADHRLRVSIDEQERIRCDRGNRPVTGVFDFDMDFDVAPEWTSLERDGRGGESHCGIPGPNVVPGRDRRS